MSYSDSIFRNLSIQPHGRPVIINLSQNENGRKIYLTLTNLEEDIPNGSVVTIAGTKPDGAVYSDTLTYSEKVVLIYETTQMTAVSGQWDAKVKVTYQGSTVASGTVRFIIDADRASTPEASSSVLTGLVAEAQQYAEEAKSAAYGSPLVASTASAMIDKTRVYVYTGSETGYTFGNWYYWDGSAWTSGGVYNSIGFDTDTTLEVSGKPADAKAVGDAIDAITPHVTGTTLYLTS